MDIEPSFPSRLRLFWFSPTLSGGRHPSQSQHHWLRTAKNPWFGGYVPVISAGQQQQELRLPLQKWVTIENIHRTAGELQMLTKSAESGADATSNTLHDNRIVRRGHCVLCDGDSRLSSDQVHEDLAEPLVRKHDDRLLLRPGRLWDLQADPDTLRNGLHGPAIQEILSTRHTQYGYSLFTTAHAQRRLETS